MLDHIGFAVSDIDRSEAFYAAALKPLGLSKQMEATAEQTESGSRAVGFGTEGTHFLWISGNEERAGEGTHIALEAATRGQVDAFHAAAIAAGGRDNGAPGVRPNYGPNYYAAFVYDPDGTNIEAVCYAAE